MALKSMTGFGRSTGSHESASWHWEIRTLNGRGLDVRVRLPNGHDAFEPRVREAAAKKLARGNVAVSLTVSADDSAGEIRLNETALVQVLKAAERVQQLTGADPPKVEGLLALKGVLEYAERRAGDPSEGRLAEELFASLDVALNSVVAARLDEGARLTGLFANQIGEIERIIAAVAVSPARSPDAIRRRLAEQVARILDTVAGLDETRLMQEAALLATRADVEEELKRLEGHAAAARALLQSSEPAGRKLDFLTQEMNREGNTLCAKSNDQEITRHGLALKAVIDQMREQVQNIE